jgi:hypothetical protein
VLRSLALRRGRRARQRDRSATGSDGRHGGDWRLAARRSYHEHLPARDRELSDEVGADADIAIFDPARVVDRATFENPAQYSDGFRHVLVNGVFVVRDSKLVDSVFPGRPFGGRRPANEENVR